MSEPFDYTELFKAAFLSEDPAAYLIAGDADLIDGGK